MFCLGLVLLWMTSLRLWSQACSVDTSFIPALETGADIYAIALQPDGKILIGGAFVASSASLRVTNLARLNIDGSLDSTFDSATAVDLGYVSAITIQPDGQILVGGNFYSSLSLNQGIMTRLNQDGTEDSSFDYNLFIDSEVKAIVLQPDGKIVIGGSFVVVDFVLRRNIARLNSDGTIDFTFDACVAASDGAGATALAVQPDRKILAAGIFSFSTGYTRTGLARLGECGELDPDYAPEPGVDSSSRVFALRLRDDGRVLLGGNFTEYHSVARAGLVQLTPEGNVDLTFDPGEGVERSNSVFTIAFDTNGKVIVGGSFKSYGGVQRAGVARLNSDGSIDSSCDPGAGANNWVSTLVAQSNGMVIAGGKFSAFDSLQRNGLCRLANDRVPPRLSVPVIVGNRVLMSVYGESGVAYSVEGTTNYTDWRIVTNFTAIDREQTISDGDAGLRGYQFYRARVR